MKLTELRLSDRTERELGKNRWLEIGQVEWVEDGSGLMITAQDESSAFVHVWRVSYPDGELHRITNDPVSYTHLTLPTIYSV